MERTQRGRSRMLGITLIEQIVALAVVAILASVATPSLAGLLRRGRIQTAQMDFLAGLRFARAEAVMRNTRVVFCPTQDGRHCSDLSRWEDGWLAGLDRDHDNQPDAAPLRIGEGHPQVFVQSSQARRHVTFRPDGTAGGSNLTLLFCNVGHTPQPLGVVVSNSGRVRGSYPDAREAAGCEAG